jgi:ATP-dependent RNA helicase RhlE
LLFEEFGLSAEILGAVSEQGYEQPTPIQEQAIPHVLAGRDLLGRAQTGTGKTAAFALPMLERLRRHANTSFSPARHSLRALILAPTRELAVQDYEAFLAYGRHVPLRYSVVYGGVPIEPQTKALLAGVEVLVATPGRLLDHLGQRNMTLSTVEAFVLDEGDRMLDMGFLPDITRIVDLLPANRQTMLFSATFSPEVRRLAAKLLRQPVSVDVAPQVTSAESVTQVVYLVDERRKRELLAELVRKRDLHQVLVFTRTKLQAGRLASQLDRDGIAAVAIHGDRSQPDRERALAGFKTGEVQVLVATDVAARGLDIESLPLVVNYELPHTAHDYVHRIGRTGRAGAAGRAISLVAPDEEDYLKAVNRLLKRDLPVRVVKGFEPTAASRSPGRRSAAVRPARRSTSERSRPRAQAGRRAVHHPGTGRPAGAAVRSNPGDEESTRVA